MMNKYLNKDYMITEILTVFVCAAARLLEGTTFKSSCFDSCSCQCYKDIKRTLSQRLLKLLYIQYII